MSEETENLSYLGQTTVNRVDLISFDNKRINIAGMFSEISIYEDLFSNTMSGHILIEDSLDLINSVPLIGQEQIIIEQRHGVSPHSKSPALPDILGSQHYLDTS